MKIEKKHNLLIEDFNKISPLLKKAHIALQEKGFAHPITVMSKDLDATRFGETFIFQKEYENEWAYTLSYLDLFIAQHVIAADKLEEFKRYYKPLEDFCCVFVLDTSAMEFMYIPYHSDHKTAPI